jgi:hypothetical protein
VVPEGYPGSNWLTGSQHQVNSTLVLGRSAARVPTVARQHSRFHSPVEARRAMWNWLDLEQVSAAPTTSARD